MPQLTESNRAKLDGIVHQMVANGEPDDAIHFVVDDFKQKYSLPTKPVSAEDFIDARSRPLLMGHSDAGAARQFSDPSAMNDLNAAKDKMANVGLWGGLAAMGGLGAGTAVASAPTLHGAGQALLVGGAAQAARAAGVPSPVVDALLLATGAKGFRGAKAGTPEAPAPRILRVGGTEVDRYLPNTGQEVPSVATSTSKGVLRMSPGRISGDPNAPGLAPPDMAPSAPSVPVRPVQHSAVAPSQPMQAPMQSPQVPTSRTSVIPQLSDLRPTLKSIEPADMPRSWHAFLDSASRETADPATLRQAQQLHKDLAEMDSAYRAHTANERAALRADPLSVRDAVMALLNGGK